jgi:tetratricopeptide (TPR) repeat protein
MARQHYEVGVRLYNVGRYEESIAEFTAGYLLVPKAEFLLDIGQAYRQLKRYDRARESFARFLHEAPLQDARRSTVAQLMSEIDAAPPPTLAAPPAAPLVNVDVKPPPERRHRRWWIGTVVAGVALVTAGAIVGGVLGAQSRPSPYPGNGGAGPYEIAP